MGHSQNYYHKRVCDNDELLKGVSSAKCMDTKMAMKRGEVIINWPQSRKGAV